MENNEASVNQKSEDKVMQDNQNLTNDQKLEYLSKLIQKIDAEIEDNENKVIMK